MFITNVCAKMFIPLVPSSGTGVFKEGGKISIRLLRKGCTNRPFYHIVVAETKQSMHAPVIEQVGSYDPYPNEHNEKLVALNYERIRFWLGNGAEMSRGMAQLLGLSGLLPIHPLTYMYAWRKRKADREAQSKENPQEESTYKWK